MPRRYDVLLTAGADRDLESIHDYISEHDSQASANDVLDQLTHVVENLEQLPERGTYLKELVGLGIRDFRQTVLKPNQIIYRVIGRGFTYNSSWMAGGTCNPCLHAGYSANQQASMKEVES